MIRWGDQSGLTLVEMLVTLIISLLLFGAVLGALEVFATDTRYDQQRNEAQDDARSAIDRLTEELRNVAAPSAGAPGALEQAGAYNLVFQTVSASQVFGGQNASNQLRVRYCLDASTPTKERLWRQTQTWTTASAPATIPSTTSCPSAAWGSQAALVSNVTNQINGQSRPVFVYGPAPATELSQLRSVKVDLFINVNPSRKRPGESELSDGTYLRNVLSPPVARFTLFQQRAKVQLNASTSTDPNGQALSYQWFLDGVAISGATTQWYETGELTKVSHTFMLTVTDTAGLSSSTEQTVTIL
jgi:prepilin-type N-terminal cleavage/methylation domain-containing protein